jgi:hypothetical protein
LEDIAAVAGSKRAMLVGSRACPVTLVAVVVVEEEVVEDSDGVTAMFGTAEPSPLSTSALPLTVIFSGTMTLATTRKHGARA